MVDWSEPIFHDNSVTPLQIVRTPDRMDISSMNGKNNAILAEDQGIGMGLFPIGTSTIVKYTATDASGNDATCNLDITVQGNHFHFSQKLNQMWKNPIFVSQHEKNVYIGIIF